MIILKTEPFAKIKTWSLKRPKVNFTEKKCAIDLKNLINLLYFNQN